MASGTILIDKGQITSQTTEPDGSITIKATLPCNEDITLTATPLEGYTLEYIKKNGNPEQGIAPEGDSILWNSDEEPTINIRFKKTNAPTNQTFKVKVFCDVPVNFRFSPAGEVYRGDIQGQMGGAGPGQFGVEQTYNQGDTLTIIASISQDAWLNQITPFELLALTIYSDTPSTVAPNFLGMMTAVFTTTVNRNMEISIQSRIKNTQTYYNVNALIAGNTGGTVSPPTASILAGGSTSITISPAAGYRITYIKKNGQFITDQLPSTGGVLAVNEVLQHTNIEVRFDLIGNNISDAGILFWLASRLVSNGAGTRAEAWFDTSSPNTSPYLRSVQSNGQQVNNFTLPFTYYGTYLYALSSWNTPEGVYSVWDEFYDNKSDDYLRLAVQAINKNGANLEIVTRLNNYWGNGLSGFTQGQVAKCQLKITDPDQNITTFNHPVQYVGNNITQITHVLPLVKKGLYIIETETVLVAGNKRSSYSISYLKIE